MGTLGTQMQPFFEWLVRSTIQAGLIVCLILLLQAAFRNKLGVRWHHALWLILVIRMVLPWTPQSRLSVFNVVAWWDQPRESHSSLMEPSDRPPATSSTESSTNQPPGSGAATSANGQPKNVDRVPRGSQKPDGSAMSPPRRTRDILPLVWAVGALALGAYVVASNVKLWRATSIEPPSTDRDVLELLEECRARMGLRTIVALVTSEKVNTPVLLGFIRPRLLIPRDIAKQLSREELRYVFLHELAHVKRHDIALAWLTALLQVLHWFNPLVWLAFHRMRCDRELACDALVLTRTQGEGTKDYGRAIVSLLERFSFPPPLPGLAGILENKSQLKRRMTMITRFKNNSYRWSPLAVALIVVLGCVSLPDAKSGKAAQPSAAKPTGASAAGEQPAAPVVGGSNVFVDPNTGIRFTKFKTLSGPSDVIQYPWRVTLSPSGKFLLNHVRVVPLDGSTPFDLVNMPDAAGGLLSPDGRKVVFCGTGAMWLIEVDPDTGRPAGSPKKLLDGHRYPPTAWSPDSQRIVFPRRYSQPGDAGVYSPWTLALEGGVPSPLADPSSFGLLSPDGKTVAYVDGQYTNSGSVRVKAVAGEEARKFGDGSYRPLAWSADGQWLVCEGRRLRFVHMADGREVKVTIPARPIQNYPQGRRLFFYQGSYEDKAALRVVSVAGGPPTDFGWPNLSFENWPGHPWWAHDSHSILVEGKRGEDQWGFWAVPLDRKAPEPLTIDTPLCRQSLTRVLSPDGSKLLLCTGQRQGDWELWTVPVSLAQMRSTGPAVRIFSGMVPPARGDQWALDIWSPDGSKIAFVHNWDIWVAGADGKDVLQLTKTPERDGWPIWSPDSTLVAFNISRGDKTPRDTRTPPGKQICVVPASGGPTKVVADLTHVRMFNGPKYAWSPDSKALTIASEDEGVIANFPIAGGAPKTVARFKELGMEEVSRQRWSPDGQFLAFEGATGTDRKLYVYHPDSAKLQRLSDDYASPFYWSPDSKWLCHWAWQTVKTRPEAVVWEMDVEEALAKLAK